MQQSWAELRNARQPTALAAIEQDIENIRAAWRYWLAEKNSAQLLKFMDSFWIVYDIRGWYHAGLELFEEAAMCLTQPSMNDGAKLVKGKALGYVGYYTGIVGHPERGVTLYEEAIALIYPLNQPEALSYAYYSAALSGSYLGDFDLVIEAAQVLGRISREMNDPWVEATSLNFQAVALIAQRKLAEAREKSDSAIQKFGQEIGEYFGLTWAASIRGQVAMAQGAYAEAKLFYERSLEAAKVLNYRRTTQQAFDNLGDVAYHLGEIEQAEQYFRLSLEVSGETGQTREMLATLHDLATVWAAQGKKIEAVELLAIVLHHPLSNLPLLLRTENTPLREAAQRLQASLKGELSSEDYTTAWSRGQTLTLESAVAGLLR
jgi:tetratricopeptide (TPR) repeat protein